MPCGNDQARRTGKRAYFPTIRKSDTGFLKFGREVRVLPGFASAQKGGVRVPILPMQAGSNRDWYGWRASSTHQETLMARSIRLIYRNIKGRVRQNFGWDGLTERSAVLITAAEWRPTADPFDSPPGRPSAGRSQCVCHQYRAARSRRQRRWCRVSSACRLEQPLACDGDHHRPGANRRADRDWLGAMARRCGSVIGCSTSATACISYL
jgi:hypothetical protein